MLRDSILLFSLLAVQPAMAKPTISSWNGGGCTIDFRWKSWKEHSRVLTYQQVLKGQVLDFADSQNFSYFEGEPAKHHVGKAPTDLRDYKLFVKLDHVPTSGWPEHEDIAIQVRVEGKIAERTLAGPWKSTTVRKLGTPHDSPEDMPILEGEVQIAGAPLILMATCGGQLEKRAP